MSLTLKEHYLRFGDRKLGELTFLRDDTVVEARAELLEPFDRDLIKAVLIYNQPTKMVAKLAHISTLAVRYRVRKLVARIISPEFVAVARSLHLLNADQAAVAGHHILQGKSIEATAEATGMPYHAIRRALAEINGITKGMRNLKENYPSLVEPPRRSPRKVKCTE